MAEFRLISWTFWEEFETELLWQHSRLGFPISNYCIYLGAIQIICVNYSEYCVNLCHSSVLPLPPPHSYVLYCYYLLSIKRACPRKIEEQKKNPQQPHFGKELFRGNFLTKFIWLNLICTSHLYFKKRKRERGRESEEWSRRESREREREERETERKRERKREWGIKRERERANNKIQGNAGLPN